MACSLFQADSVLEEKGLGLRAMKENTCAQAEKNLLFTSPATPFRPQMRMAGAQQPPDLHTGILSFQSQISFCILATQSTSCCSHLSGNPSKCSMKMAMSWEPQRGPRFVPPVPLFKVSATKPCFGRFLPLKQGQLGRTCPRPVCYLAQ